VLDAIDSKILSLLSQNGRASFASIGEEVGLSPHGTADRIRRLERTGVITGYSVEIDLGRVGRSLDALIDVRLMPSTDPTAFERRLATLSAVREMAFVTGRFDYQLRVACLDADDLDQTVRAIRGEAGAAGTETRIVMRSASFGQSVDESVDRRAEVIARGTPPSRERVGARTPRRPSKGRASS
jgi:Lrp/AsnC family transcriptional regulator, leucine-responsive regulatory protein